MASPCWATLFTSTSSQSWRSYFCTARSAKQAFAAGFSVIFIIQKGARSCTCELYVGVPENNWNPAGVLCILSFHLISGDCIPVLPEAPKHPHTEGRDALISILPWASRSYNDTICQWKSIDMVKGLLASQCSTPSCTPLLMQGWCTASCGTLSYREIAAQSQE